MRSIGRAVALVAVLGMPAIAYVLARVAFALWSGMDSAAFADAGVALEDGLTLLAAAVGATIAAYLALTGYAMLLGAAWRGGCTIPSALAALAPQGWTRVTATALGLSMSAGLAGPALAAEGGPTHFASAGWVDAPISVVAPISVDAPISVVADASATAAVGWGPAPASATAAVGWGPAPASASLHADAVAPASLTVGWVATGDTREATPQPSSAYVVQPGDSLWHITAALLGTDASTAQVAAAWPALYEANRDSIGENPSLIHPGLALTVPAGLGA